MQFGCVTMSADNFFVCGPKFANFLSPNVGGVEVDQLLFQFSIYGSVPEIFTIKLESCLKSRNFALPNFRGRAFPKSCAHVNTLPRGTSRGKDSYVTPTSCKVIGAHTLNFKLNFTCSPLNFLEDPIPVRGVR